MRLRFWNRRIQWGFKLPDHIFLGDAVTLAGQKLFKDVWTETDPAYRIYPELPSWYNLDTEMWMIRRACHLLKNFDGTYKERIGADYPWNLLFPTQDEWMIARELNEEENKTNISKAERFSFVCREICGLFQNNIVTSYARPSAGGDPIPLPASVWFTERFWQRFDACRIDLQDPFQTRSPHATTDLLYLDRSAFSALIEAPGPIPAQSSEDEVATDKQIALIKRGRPPKYNWDSFNQEVIRRVLEVGIPNNKRAFSSEMLMWCLDTWGHEPGEATVRTRLTKLLPTIDIGD